jgi:hypothetical protein
VPDSVDGLSCLVTSMFMAAELLEGRFDAATANGVRWGSRSTLVTAVSGGGHKMHISTANIPTFHARYRR